MIQCRDGFVSIKSLVSTGTCSSLRVFALLTRINSHLTAVSAWLLLPQVNNRGSIQIVVLIPHSKNTLVQVKVPALAMLLKLSYESIIRKMYFILHTYKHHHNCPELRKQHFTLLVFKIFTLCTSLTMISLLLWSIKLKYKVVKRSNWIYYNI